MRLIDADGVIEEIKRNKLLAREPAAGRIIEIINNATTFCPAQLGCDVNKVVERLEELFNRTKNKDMRLAYHRAIELVKAGGADE